MTEVATAELGGYFAANRERHLAEFAQFLELASVSADPQYAREVLACADWVAHELERIGLENVRLIPTPGNPIAYGDWLHAGPGAPTALLYGHYDVQPPEPFELWTSPPFEPTLRDGRIYARGSTDNKGPIFTNLKAIEGLLATAGTIPCNVRVIVEGEEEVRADHLEEFVRSSPDLLAADVAVISDSAMYGRGQPALPLGLRGMAAIEITLRGNAHDLHSGIYGGTVPNAVAALAELVASLHTPDGSVAVAGFYDRVRPLADDERADWSRVPFDEAALRAETGATELVGEPAYTPLERVWGRPTLEPHGIWGGYQGPGVKTVIPAEAHAKLSCRLVPDQDPHDVLRLLRAHLERHAPRGTSVSIDFELPGAWPVLTPRDHPAVRAAQAALRDGFGREPLLIRSGWSVPVTEILQRNLGLESVLLGFGLPEENAHAPDEHFHLENLDGGIRTMAAFWPRLAEELPHDGGRLG